MANVSVNNIVSKAKSEALPLGTGFLGGVVLQKVVNKMFGSEKVVNGLGAETATGLKNYATPLIVTAIGVGINLTAKDDFIKKVGTGVAVSGVANVGMQFFWKKNLLSGLNGGMLGDILGTDADIDAEDGFSGNDDDDPDGFAGNDDDEDDLNGLGNNEEEQPIAALPMGNNGQQPAPAAENSIAALDIPIDVPPMRDAAYEREHIEGLGYTPDGLIL